MTSEGIPVTGLEVANPNQFAISETINKLDSQGWFGIRSRRELPSFIPIINRTIGNIHNAATHSGVIKGATLLGTLTEMEARIDSILGAERYAQIESDVFNQSEDYALDGLSKAAGKPLEDLTPEDIELAANALKVAARALAWREVRDADHATKTPNLYAAILQSYALGAVGVFITGGGKREIVTVHIPVSNGFNRLMCHTEGTRTPSVFHGWDENCNYAETRKSLLPQEEIEGQTASVPTDQNAAEEELEDMSPEEIENEVKERIAHQNNRYRELKAGDQPITVAWRNYARRHGL